MLIFLAAEADGTGLNAEVGDPGWVDWFMSPGFGGAAALVAAALTFLAARFAMKSQLTVEREKRDQELTVERERRRHELEIERKRRHQEFQIERERREQEFEIERNRGEQGHRIERKRREQEHRIAEQERNWEMFRWAAENKDLDVFVLLAFVRHLKKQSNRLNDTTMVKLLEEYTRGILSSVWGPNR